MSLMRKARARLSDAATSPEDVAAIADIVGRAYTAALGRNSIHAAVRNAFIASVAMMARAERRNARDVRSLMRAAYAEAAEALDLRATDIAIQAWRADHNKWHSLRKAIASFESNVPSIEAIEKAWQRDPRSHGIRAGKL